MLIIGVSSVTSIVQENTAIFEIPESDHFEVKVFCTLKNNYANIRIKNDDQAIVQFTMNMTKLVSQKKISKQNRGNYIGLFKLCLDSKCQEKSTLREDKVIPFRFRAVAVRK